MWRAHITPVTLVNGGGKRGYSQQAHRLVCGLEIHTQLATQRKLFSLSRNNPFQQRRNPNSNVSYFDAALPGSRPRINYQCVLYALQLALALNCKINLKSQFDRKHYFYADQPMGYQITQHYNPIATTGQLLLFGKYDDIDEPVKKINIIQLQLEQDTAMSHKSALVEENILVDLNRTNVPLIELVTKPDFTSIRQVIAFIKKYQDLVRHLGICTGDMESSALRVDVNVSVDDYQNRVELKNLPNTSSIAKAIEFEFKRQCNLINSGQLHLLTNETRGWDGLQTFKLRDKETSMDYRYIPDPELPILNLDNDIIDSIKKSLPESTDSQIGKFLDPPYNLSLKDAKILSIHRNFNDLYTNEQIKSYYLETFRLFNQDSNTIVAKSKNLNKHIINWILHDFIGNLNKYNLPFLEIVTFLPPREMSNFLLLIYTDKISSNNGKLLLKNVIQGIKENGYQDSKINWDELIDEFNIRNLDTLENDKLILTCNQIIEELNDPKLIESIKNGTKQNSFKFLIGLGMKKFKGKVPVNDIIATFEKILQLK